MQPACSTTRADKDLTNRDAREALERGHLLSKDPTAELSSGYGEHKVLAWYYPARPDDEIQLLDPCSNDP